MIILVFLAFLAGALLGGLGGYALGASRSPSYFSPNYYTPHYATPTYAYYSYQPCCYPTASYQPYPTQFYQPYQSYGHPYGWHPWYGYW